MLGMSTNPLFLAGIISPPFDRNPAAALLLHGLVKLAKVIRESAHIALRGTRAWRDRRPFAHDPEQPRGTRSHA